MKKALTIAGSDCSGGAGVQADIKTFSALGVYAMSVIVAVVAENTNRVIGIENVSPDMIKKQIEAVFEDIGSDGVKIGMLSDVLRMEAVCEGLSKYRPQNVVIDPVMYAKGGAALMTEDSVEYFIKNVLPSAFLLTPNIPEAERISGMEIKNTGDMKKACEIIHKMGAENVLIKGGHKKGGAEDILYAKEEFSSFSAERIDTKNTHGTGCTLSSAITANLAAGSDLYTAVYKAKEYITGAIANSLEIGKGHGPTNHFYRLWK